MPGSKRALPSRLLRVGALTAGVLAFALLVSFAGPGDVSWGQASTAAILPSARGVAAAATYPSTVGQWSAPIPWPTVAVHAMLLPTGKVLTWGDGGPSANVWDPAFSAFESVPDSLTNLLCAGMNALPDGRIIVVGGGGLQIHGVSEVNVFDPNTERWSQLAPTQLTTWYAGSTVLPDGRMVRLGGVGGCNNCNPEAPEVYTPATNTWTSLTAATTLLPMYPFTFVRPDG